MVRAPDLNPALSTWNCFTVAPFSNPRPRFVASYQQMPCLVCIFVSLIHSVPSYFYLTLFGLIAPKV